MQILEEGGISVQDTESNHLLDYFRDVVLVTAARLQSWTSETTPIGKHVSNETPCEDFGNELLHGISGLLPQEVGIFPPAI